MPTYRGFPAKLHHRVPHWVEPGSLFHIRIALDREKAQKLLIAPRLGKALLDSARFYEVKQCWHITLFLLMPDHYMHPYHFKRTNRRAESLAIGSIFRHRSKEPCGKASTVTIAYLLMSAV